MSLHALPGDTQLHVRTRLLVDAASHKVLRHEDDWAEVACWPRLPQAWKRANGVWTGWLAVLLGWRGALERAETVAAARGE